MLLRYTGVFACLGFLSLCWAYKVTPIIGDDVYPFVKIGNGYYYIENNKRANWYQAYIACRKMGAELVSFETREELDAMDAYIPIEYSLRQYWTSGTDLAVKGMHVWFSNAEPLADDVWYPGEPNDAGGNERCDILIYKGTGGTAINDRQCDSVELYICEVPLPKEVSFIW
ncbi:C-type lectin 37Da-like [Drosophila obscura]|uniref:C-type lectin 37Da-like n=1 Tax=Drosophila obscura TaxID=7282 RepID=UPI000BA0E3F1|nr:C-type lectin 37Da-like [Drosophila obscura]